MQVEKITRMASSAQDYEDINHLAVQKAVQTNSDGKPITTHRQDLYSNWSPYGTQYWSSVTTSNVTTLRATTDEMTCIGPIDRLVSKFRNKVHVRKRAADKIKKVNAVPKFESDNEEVAALDSDGDELYVNYYDPDRSRRRKAAHGRPINSSLKFQPTESADPRPPLDWPEPPPPPLQDI